jgi:hypothetical protein
MSHFGLSDVDFLRFVISPSWIGIESVWISKTDDWTFTESIQDKQAPLPFTNFKRRFIRNYAMVTPPISDVQKNHKISRAPKQLTWEWTWDAELVFW